MHPVLRIEKVERMACLNESVKERSWPLNLKGISRTKLLLIANENNLLGIDWPKKSFILLDHSSFIHNHSIKLSFTEGFRACFANRCYYYWSIFKNLIFKLPLVLHKDLKLFPWQHFDCLYIVAKEVYVLLFDWNLFLFYVENGSLFVTKICDAFLYIYNCRKF